MARDRKARIKTYAFDAAEFLDTPEAVAAYLTDALASDSAAEFQDALSVVARARGMTEIAKSAGLDRKSLYNALRADAATHSDAAQRLIAALGRGC